MLSILDITESSYIANMMPSQQGGKTLSYDAYPWAIVKRRAVPVAAVEEVVVVVVIDEIIRSFNSY